METTQSSEGDFWRERAEQLEGALDSRITIEQAKGVLAERLGLDIDGAFSVLRGAARSDRAKLHELARAVVASNETPVTIIRFPPRPPRVLHSADDLFAILPGHEIPEIETVVTHNGYYAIVQKRVG